MPKKSTPDPRSQVLLSLTPELAARFQTHVLVKGDCWIWTGALTHGYPLFNLRAEQNGAGPQHAGPRKTTARAVHVSYALFSGAVPPRKIRMSCGDPLCVRAEHVVFKRDVSNLGPSPKPGPDEPENPPLL